MAFFGPPIRVALIGIGLMSLTGCQDAFEFDFRSLGAGFSTSGQAQVADRPDADNRGVISYPSYQVAVAREGGHASRHFGACRAVADRAFPL